MSKIDVLKPCPFCGTRLDDADFPGAEIRGGGFSYECGCCGANWPLLTREKLESMSDDADVVAFFNQRRASA